MATPTASGTQMAMAASSIAPHGVGTSLGRTVSVSQAGMASDIQP